MPTDTCPTCGSSDPKVNRGMNAHKPPYDFGYRITCTDSFHATPSPTPADEEVEEALHTLQGFILTSRRCSNSLSCDACDEVSAPVCGEMKSLSVIAAALTTAQQEAEKAREVVEAARRTHDVHMEWAAREASAALGLSSKVEAAEHGIAALSTMKLLGIALDRLATHDGGEDS